MCLCLPNLVHSTGAKLWWTTYLTVLQVCTEATASRVLPTPCAPRLQASAGGRCSGIMVKWSLAELASNAGCAGRLGSMSLPAGCMRGRISLREKITVHKAFVRAHPCTSLVHYPAAKTYMRKALGVKCLGHQERHLGMIALPLGSSGRALLPRVPAQSTALVTPKASLGDPCR